MALMDIQPVEFEDTPDPAIEGVNDDGQHEERTDEEFEAQARADGWVPPAEMRNPGRRPPMTAKEFVIRGETILPLVNAKNRELRQKIDRQAGQMEALTRTVAEQKEAIDAAMNLARTAGDRGYKRALADLEAKRDAAVEIGDQTAFRQTQDEIDVMKEERRAADAPAPRAAAPLVVPVEGDPPPGMHPDVHEFTERPDNAWFKADQGLREALMAHHQLVRIRTPGLSMAEELRRARAALVEDFPEKFGRARAAPQEDPSLDPDEDERPLPSPRRAAPVMTPGVRSERGRPASDPFSQIPDHAERAELRAEFAKLQRGDPNASASEFVQIYLDPKADVLSMLQKRKK